MSTMLDVFISSKMVELKPERDALFALISALDYGDIKLHAWVFEEDAGASGKNHDANQRTSTLSVLQRHRNELF